MTGLPAAIRARHRPIPFFPFPFFPFPFFPPVFSSCFFFRLFDLRQQANNVLPDSFRESLLFNQLSRISLHFSRFFLAHILH